MQLWVKVVPRSGKFAVATKNNAVIIYAAEEPTRGRVNAEITKELERALGRTVRIAAGATARRKLLDICGSEAEVLDEIKKIARR